MFGFRRHSGPPAPRPPAFVEYRHDRITLLHPRRWPLAVPPARFVIAGVFDLIDLADLFGFPFDRPLVVRLFPTCAALSAWVGSPAAGVADPASREVAVGADADDPVRVLRHELAHLFSAAWGELAPSLKSEGLARWWDRKPEGRAFDRELDGLLASAGCRPRLREMLDEGFFHAPERVLLCYALAGSFTGWLVRRYGWVRYREFFRRGTPDRLEAAFEKLFGLRFDAAEHVWEFDRRSRR